MKRYPRGRPMQFVWWGWKWYFGFVRFDPEKTDMAKVYRWILSLGPIEFRRWTPIPR